MTRSRLLSLLAALAVTACAQSAVLELQVELPAAPSGDPEPWFAQVQVRRSSAAFDATWAGPGPRAIQLGSEPQWDCISVQSDDESVDLNVRVRFCRSIDCEGLGDDMRPERRYSLERPFYLGRRTYWATSIDRVPECTTDEDCALGACLPNGHCGCTTDADCCPDGGCACPGGQCYACVAEGCVQQVDRCRIQGCVVGGSPSRFCTEDDRHFCEAGAYDRTEAYMCTLPD